MQNLLLMKKKYSLNFCLLLMHRMFKELTLEMR